jgi:hypothetical protein
MCTSLRLVLHVLFLFVLCVGDTHDAALRLVHILVSLMLSG